MQYKLWTKEEEQKLKSLLGTMSFEEMTQKYFPERAPSSLQCHSKSLGFSNPYIRRIHSKDETFWSIPNPLNCYYAGNFAADGYIYEPGNLVRWEVSIGDLNHLERLKTYTGATNEIVTHWHKNPSNPNKKCHLARLHISACQKWIKDMKRNFNLCQNKTHILSPPNLTSDYLKFCYLIGYIDGDGTICADSRGVLCIRFASCSPHVLNWIKDLMDRYFNIAIRDRGIAAVNRTDNHYHYAVTGIRAAKLFEFLSAFDLPKFDRKWKQQKVLEKIDYFRQKYPKFWGDDKIYKFDPNGALIAPKFDRYLADNHKSAL